MGGCASFRQICSLRAPPPRDVIFCSHRTAAGDAPQLRGAKWKLVVIFADFFRSSSNKTETLVWLWAAHHKKNKRAQIQTAAVPHPINKANWSVSDLNHPPTSAEQLSWKSHSLFWDQLRSWIGTSHAEGGRRCWSRRRQRRDGAGSHPWPARSWGGSALDQLWATRAPGWGDGAESISTRLSEPASALIVITRPGPISTRPSLQFAVRCGITRPPRTRGRDQPDLSVVFAIVIMLAVSHATESRQRPEDDSWRRRPSTVTFPSRIFGITYNCFRPILEIWWLVYLFPILPVLVGSSGLIFQPQNQHFSSQYMSN